MISFPPGATGAQRPHRDSFLTPAHPNKHVRRTATSVLGGRFDRPLQPARPARSSSTVLAHVENVAWARAARDGHAQKSVKVHTTPTSRLASSGGMPAPTHTTHPPSRLSTQWSTSAPDLSQFPFHDMYEDHGDLYSAGESSDEDNFDPVGPVVSSPRPISEADSILSWTSSHRPLTPFGSDATSPTTTMSPGLPRDEHGFHKGHYGASEFVSLSSFEKPRGVIRPRSGSATTDTDVPLAKKSKVGRPRKYPLGGAASVAAPSATSPTSLDDEEVIRDCLGRARPPRRKTSIRKGWKGWIEVDETQLQPPTTLIKLDAPAEIITDRRTRSGRNFDG
ncbi:hypothetical protein BKA62DRAFT_708879 [Auriculariales sp. MPI-PUGE-AT-0066]|nr:hypothetical protein BKA62DRAFT_708879 [Auriculariales sp. MPI-PUGE-AT-0066]